MKETDAFRVLGSADRQLLLHELVRADGELTEAELACQVAARRHRRSPDSISDEKIKRAHIRLIHQHFPLLRDLQIIEQNGDEVRLTEDKRRAQLLDAAKQIEAWPPADLLQRTPSK